jgi:hypothetical protein
LRKPMWFLGSAGEEILVSAQGRNQPVDGVVRVGVAETSTGCARQVQFCA